MAATKGNQFWKQRSKHGRNRIFTDPEVLWQEAVRYFNWRSKTPFYKVEQKRGNVILPSSAQLTEGQLSEMIQGKVYLEQMQPFTIHSLCLFLGVNTKYFNDFESSLDKLDPALAESFSEVITRIKDTIYDQKFSGAAAGFFQHNIIARDLGLKENTNMGLGDQEGKPLTWDIQMAIK